MKCKLAFALFGIGLVSVGQADPIFEADGSEVTITYRGTVLTGATAGTNIHGTATFPVGLPDLISGPSEDWWEIFGYASFSAIGDGASFNTTIGTYSSLRIKDTIGEDALRFDADAGPSGESLLLILSQGGSEALFSGSNGLTGNVPLVSADPTLFAPCQEIGGRWSGSCSQFSAIGQNYLFQLTEFSITQTTQVPEPGTLALLGLGLAGIGFARRKKA